MDEFVNYVKIPKERIAVIIGEKGTTKSKLENKMKVKLIVDSEEGEVEIQAKDSIHLLDSTNIIKAIARGFNPNKALKLLDENATSIVINISDYVGKSKNKLQAIKGRLIGTEGKSRKTLEKLTKTEIVVYGKTVAIIGQYDEVDMAKRAVENLLTGSKHATVYRMLEEQRRKLKTKF